MVELRVQRVVVREAYGGTLAIGPVERLAFAGTGERRGQHRCKQQHRHWTDAFHRLPFSTNCPDVTRSEEHTSELQSLMRPSYAVFCLKKKKKRLGLQYI